MNCELRAREFGMQHVVVCARVFLTRGPLALVLLLLMCRLRSPSRWQRPISLCGRWRGVRANALAILSRVWAVTL